MKQAIWIFSALGLVASTLAAAAPEDRFLGNWRTIDDRTGFTKAIVNFAKAEDGTIQGTIVKVKPRPGYTAKQLCQKCPGEFKDKPIEGLRIIWNMKVDPKRPDQLVGGQVIDPLSGKIYSLRTWLNADGKRMTLRGYVSVSALGRNQTWVRAEGNDTSL